MIPGSGRTLEKEMATHSSIRAWRIPWTEEPGGLQSNCKESDLIERLTLSLGKTKRVHNQRRAMAGAKIKARPSIKKEVSSCVLRYELTKSC